MNNPADASRAIAFAELREVTNFAQQTSCDPSVGSDDQTQDTSTTQK
jgi:hypothetical protein